jgi:hypothetical protein
MALIGNSFLKVVPITVSSGEATTGTLSRTYTNTRVEDLSTISVFYNGQAIPGGSAPVTPTSKYYYEVTRTLTPSDMTSYMSGNIVPSDTSSLVVALKHNAAYQGPGYTSGTSATNFLVSDSFIVTYYYVIYTVK